MKNIKRLKLKILSIVMLIAILSLEFSPFSVKATAQQLQFYSAGSVSVGYDSYNGKNVFYGYSTLGGNIAYCVDYTCALPSGTMYFSRYLSDQGLAVLIHGYPNISAAQLGVNDNQEAYMATQMALWEVLNRTGESKKSGRIFRVENVTPKAGMEGFYQRTTAAAAKLVAMAESSPVTDVPTLVINTQSVQRSDLGSDSLIGPYYINVTGLSASTLKSINVSLEGAPSSARLTDANGNTKTSFANGDAVYVRLNSSENTTSFKVNFTSDVDRKVGLIYTKSGNVQDYTIIDTIPNSMSNSVTINWNKVNVNGAIELVKVDQDNKPIAGVEFNLLNSSGEVMANRKTGSDGKINFYNVPAGNYVLEEVSAPEGYKIINKTTNVTVKSGETTPVKVINESISGEIIITKIDDSNKPLKGVVFEIYDEKGNSIKKITTDSNGKASATVEYGTYYFKEISAPEGYIMDDTLYKFSVTEENRTFYKTVTNKTYKGSLVIVKTDENNTPIEGVKFNILNEKGEVVITITTNKNGMAGVSNLSYGKYYYQEVEAPDNVVMDTNKYEFKITKDNEVIKKEIVNELVKGKIEITKIDSTSSKIANVKFNILDENGKVVDTIVTDKNGVAASKELPIGTYYYQEVEVPNGYVIDTQKYVFNITNNTTIKKTVVNDIATGKLKVIKYDNAGNYLANVKFNILDEKGNIVDTITTNKSGVALSKSLPLGTYYYQEIEAPDGIKIDTEKHVFKLSENNQTITKNIVNKYENGKLKVIKVDENNKPLAGVKFNILDENKNVIDTMVTNKDGIAESKDLVKGTYYFQEIEAPEGIIVDDTIYEFVIEYDGQVVIKNIINNYEKGSIVITKYNSAGKLLQGVKFQILDEAKQVVDTIVTDENGVATSKNLVLGTYYYQEVEAPDNVIMDTQLHEFILSENNQVVKKTVVNELAQGSLKILKIDENENPIKGVKFNILDENKQVVDTIVTDEEGVATSKELSLGTYYYQEVEAPDNVIMDTQLHEFVLSQNNQVIKKTVINELVEGSLKIIKVDENEKPLEGVKFNILDENKEVIDTIVTDKNGIAVSKELEKGTYYYQEIEAPEGIIIDDTIYEFVIEENGQNVIKNMINYYQKGKLVINKYDSNNNKLSNVKFNILDENGNVVDTIVTDEDGVATSKDLIVGTYYYQEVEAPSNVEIDTERHVFELTENNQVITKEVINKLIEGKIIINKVNEDNEPIANVKFNILDENKNVIDTIITDQNGVASTEKLPDGIYYYQEIETPKEYKLDDSIVKMELENGVNAEAKVVNYYSEGKLHIIKVDENNEPLEGIKFNILDENKEVIDTIVTDENGVAVSKDLDIGTYYYQEIEAPEGIIVDNNQYEFTIEYDGQNVITNMVNYYIKGKLQITKLSENTNETLAGAKFVILDENRNEVEIIETNENGIAISNDLLYGTYYFKEIEAPSGYIRDDQEYTFTIDSDGVIYNSVIYNQKQSLPITGGTLSSNAQVVILVSIVSILGYAMASVLRKREEY